MPPKNAQVTTLQINASNKYSRVRVLALGSSSLKTGSRIFISGSMSTGTVPTRNSLNSVLMSTDEPPTMVVSIENGLGPRYSYHGIVRKRPFSPARL